MKRLNILQQAVACDSLPDIWTVLAVSGLAQGLVALGHGCLFTDASGVRSHGSYAIQPLPALFARGSASAELRAVLAGAPVDHVFC